MATAFKLDRSPALLAAFVGIARLPAALRARVQWFSSTIRKAVGPLLSGPITDEEVTQASVAMASECVRAVNSLLEVVSADELLEAMEVASMSLGNDLETLFLGDDEALDTLQWCSELLASFALQAGHSLADVRTDQPIPPDAIEQFARDRRFGGLLRGVTLVQALALLAETPAHADLDRRARGLELLNAAFLELCGGVDAFRFAGLVVQPFASEGTGRVKRFQRAAADLRVVLSPDDERALELARLHSLR